MPESQDRGVPVQQDRRLAGCLRSGEAHQAGAHRHGTMAREHSLEDKQQLLTSDNLQQFSGPRSHLAFLATFRHAGILTACI